MMAPSCLIPSFVLGVLVLAGHVLQAAGGHAPNSVPPGWERVCTARLDTSIMERYIAVKPEEREVIHIKCGMRASVTPGLKFQTFREWSAKSPTARIFLEISCKDDKATISLPWPVKAHGLMGLEVTGCVLTDKYADFRNPEIAKIPEQLKIYDIRHSVWLSDDIGFEKLTSDQGLADLSSDYDCGQDSSIVHIVTRNVSDQLNPVHSTSDNGQDNQDFMANLQKLIEKGDNLTSQTAKPHGLLDGDFMSQPERTFDLLEKIQSLQIKCNYEKLEMLEESYQLMPKFHTAVMLQGTTYPKLRIMNFKASGMMAIPKELQEFRRNFPSLEYLDLSFNNLTNIELAPSRPPAEAPLFSLNARHNNISHVTLTDVTSWLEADLVQVDIRDNPIHCDCQVEQLVRTIESVQAGVGLERYGYISDMTCATPPELRGTTLRNLNLCKPETSTLTSENAGRGGSDDTVAIAIMGAVLAFILILAVVLVIARLRHLRTKASSTKSSGQKNTGESSVEVSEKVKSSDPAGSFV